MAVVGLTNLHVQYLYPGGDTETCEDVFGWLDKNVDSKSHEVHEISATQEAPLTGLEDAANAPAEWWNERPESST